MPRNDLTPFQQRILCAVEGLGRVRVNASGQVERSALRLLASRLGEVESHVAIALDALRHDHALVETRCDFDGIEPVAWWSVHPQLISGAG